MHDQMYFLSSVSLNYVKKSCVNDCLYFLSTGVMLVSLALLCDAVIGNVQEGAMKKYSEGATLVVLYSYSIGFIIILIGLIMTNQLVSAASFATEVMCNSCGCHRNFL